MDGLTQCAHGLGRLGPRLVEVRVEALHIVRELRNVIPGTHGDDERGAAGWV